MSLNGIECRQASGGPEIFYTSVRDYKSSLQGHLLHVVSLSPLLFHDFV